MVRKELKVYRVYKEIREPKAQPDLKVLKVYRVCKELKALQDHKELQDHKVLKVYKELKVIGTLGMAPHRFESMVPLVSQKKLQPGRMVNREIALDEVEAIFQDMTRSANVGTFVVTRYR